MTDKQTELLRDIQDSCGEGAYVLGYTVYDRDGNYIATLLNCPHCGVPLTGMNSNPDECLHKGVR